MSSRELKTSKFSFVLCTNENSYVLTHSMKYIWYSPQKSKYLLFTCQGTELQCLLKVKEDSRLKHGIGADKCLTGQKIKYSIP